MCRLAFGVKQPCQNAGLVCFLEMILGGTITNLVSLLSTPFCVSKRPSTIVPLASGLNLWKSSVVKKKKKLNQNDGVGKHQRNKCQTCLSGSFLFLIAGIMDSNEGKIGHS